MGGSRQGPFRATAQMRERMQNRGLFSKPSQLGLGLQQAAARPVPASIAASAPAPASAPTPPPVPEYQPFSNFAVPDFGSQLYGAMGSFPANAPSGPAPTRPRLESIASRNPTTRQRLGSSGAQFSGSTPQVAPAAAPTPNLWNSANAGMAAGAAVF